jgi:hypothetical protein
MRLEKFITLLGVIPALFIEALVTFLIINSTLLIIELHNINVAKATDCKWLLFPIGIWAVQFVGFLMFMGWIPNNKQKEPSEPAGDILA